MDAPSPLPMTQLWLDPTHHSVTETAAAAGLTTSAEIDVGRDENGGVLADGGGEGTMWEDVTVLVIKTTLMVSIILVSVMGNVLVIISIGINRKLQLLTNYFLVSLAMADMLVASCAMTFNASVEISGKWLFGYTMCDVWNSFDVYFSTVSILHLCCISVDRYYAIVKPLEYPLYMTKSTVLLMLANVWLAPTLISFLPIFLGWYTTKDHLESRKEKPDICTFEVNKVYAIISSAISFWIPCTVMLVLYSRILQEARKQEAAILSRTNSTCTINNIQRNSASSTAQQLLAAFRSSNTTILKKYKTKQKFQQDFQLGPLPRISRSDLSTDQGPVAVCRSGSVCGRTPCTYSRKINSNFVNDSGQLGLPNEHSGSLEVSPRTISPDLSYNEESDERIDISPCGKPPLSRSSSINGHTGRGLPVRVISPVPFGRRESSTRNSGAGAGGSQHNGSHPMMRREHKAARTLGIIMGAFILCWLPFFIWYVTVTICDGHCPCPQAVVTTLFWIGYFNSTLNPFIYAYFRTDFRDAFKKTLRQLKCCAREEDLLGSFV
ncbi:octopamine receptor beta-2R [Procambarus clarkii]|uniref:octopamine receptor beta-2R n=1 Tax=Procambarus clarkii TaxID=6728 RepID=UPI001E670C60|nr:octopamine receptor beta-2R-like [Procambarus clarkii]